MKTGIELISKEREEQLKKHQFTVEQDVAINKLKQLATAAMWLIGEFDNDNPPIDWNKEMWFKMKAKPRIEKLIIAGALIAAEIDRLQYNQPKQSENHRCPHPEKYRFTDKKGCLRCSSCHGYVE